MDKLPTSTGFSRRISELRNFPPTCWSSIDDDTVKVFLALPRLEQKMLDLHSQIGSFSQGR